jgi:hypothetical protein
MGVIGNNQMDKDQIIEQIMGVIGNNRINRNQIWFQDDKCRVVTVEFNEYVNITFDMMEKISLALGTKKIFINYEPRYLYSEYMFEGSSCSIIIEMW